MGIRKFLVDAEKCTGCDLCIIACKDEHVGAEYLPWTGAQPATGHFWIDVRVTERGHIPRVKVSHLPLLCQHCANAACITACPEGAIKRRDDGLVWIDQKACTNCGLCQKACPYGVIHMNAELGVAQKCTGCAHRVDAGEQPRCAEICPHEAILFGDEGDAIFAGVEGDVLHPEYLADPIMRWQGLPKPWIAGAVIDAATDELLPGAEIIVLDLFENRPLATRTDEFGDFRVDGLVPGRKYRLRIGKDGFTPHLSIVTLDGDQDVGDILLGRADG